eukprot:1181387-Prorocentrum_minimum.AAC.2
MSTFRCGVVTQKWTSRQHISQARRAIGHSSTHKRTNKHGSARCAMSSSADSNFLETMQEAPFAALGMMEGVEPPESIKNMLSLQRTMVNVLNSAIMSALRFGMVLAGLLLPGFLLALLPNGAPAVLNKMLVWANTITLLGIFASLAAAALTIAGSVGIYLLLKFRQATQDPDFVELERQQRLARLAAFGTSISPEQTKEIVDATVRVSIWFSHRIRLERGERFMLCIVNDMTIAEKITPIRSLNPEASLFHWAGCQRSRRGAGLS